MATFRLRGDSWQVQIRRSGRTPVSRSFASRNDAEEWARRIESEVTEDLPNSQDVSDGPTIGQLLDRYERDITPTKRSCDRERDKIRVIKRYVISTIHAVKLNSEAVVRYRDERLRIVKPATVRRELAIIRHCIEIAMREWSLPITINPAHRIRLPRADNARERRLNEAEYKRLMVALDGSRRWYMKPIVIIALETGMRRSEILSLEAKNVNLVDGIAYLPLTKNGRPRRVPLTQKAVETIEPLITRSTLFPVSAASVRQGWLDVIRRAALIDFRLHDCRHEAISRFFEMGLSVPEVALISGHRSLAMLHRYTHLRPENIARKLRSLSSVS
ncbi:Tyrosine recombinase XerC [Methylorubrum aminovorans]